MFAAPADASDMMNDGVALHDSGDVQGALALYEQAKAIVEGGRSADYEEDGTRSVLWFNLGVAHEDLGDEEKAIFCYRASLRIDPGHSDAEFNHNRLVHGKSPPWREVRSWETCDVGRLCIVRTSEQQEKLDRVYPTVEAPAPWGIDSDGDPTRYGTKITIPLDSTGVPYRFEPFRVMPPEMNALRPAWCEVAKAGLEKPCRCCWGDEA
jgi:tetratricopeptide (TPR) repeat protein